MHVTSYAVFSFGYDCAHVFLFGYACVHVYCSNLDMCKWLCTCGILSFCSLTGLWDGWLVDLICCFLLWWKRGRTIKYFVVANSQVYGVLECLLKSSCVFSSYSNDITMECWKQILKQLLNSRAIWAITQASVCVIYPSIWPR